MAESGKVSSCRVILLSLAFFTIGMCVSVIGPTLPDIMSQTNGKVFSDSSLVVVSNALGAIVGLSMGILCLKVMNSFSTVAFALFVCFMVTITVPFCKSLSAAILVYFLQGLCLGFMLKGVLAQFYAYWKQQYQIILILYFILALGATFSPLITSSLVFNTKLEANDSQINSSKLFDPYLNRNERDVTERTDVIILNLTGTTSVAQQNETESTTSIYTTTKLTNITDAIANSTITENRTTFVRLTTIGENTTLRPLTTTIPANSSTSSLQQTFWDTVVSTVKKFNNAKAIYVLIAVISLVCSLSYSFICCCTSCRWMKTPPVQNSDYPFKFKTMWTSKTNFAAVATATCFTFVTGAAESNLANMLTFYCITSMNQPQSSGVLLTALFWFSVSLSRLMALFFHKKIWHVVPLGLCVGVAILSCSAAVVFQNSWLSLRISVAVFGLTSGYLGPSGFCWMDQQLGMGPWYSTVWLITVQSSRAIVPYLTACSIGAFGQKSLMVPIIQLALVVLLGLTMAAFINTVSQASQLAFVDKLVLTTNDDVFAYKKHVNEDDQVEMDQFDEFTYFDRHNAVSYFVKQPTTPSILK